MAGLLAWAADVVGGNNDNDNGNAEGGSVYILPKFTREEEVYMRELDQKAVFLQKNLQLLRQRIPSPNIAQSLPHLHADTLASNSALTLELHAHSSTRLQAQQREASLLEENAAYSKAIAAGQHQIQERMNEVQQLESKLKELNEFVTKQRIEFEELQNLVLERENHGLGKETKDAGKTDSFSSSSITTTKAEELENKTNELKSWEDKLIKLDEQWKTLQHNLSSQISPAQREKELERRLRSLTEQLVTKQAQAEALANERNALEFKLEEANEVRRQLYLGNGETSFKRNKVGRSGLATMSPSTSINARYDEPKVHSQVSTFMSIPRVMKEVGESGRKLAAVTLGSRIGELQRFMSLRSLIVGYILGLHIVVFLIISFAKLV